MSRRRSSEEQAERRHGFLDAAVAVVRRDGPTASMEAMAAEAGVTKPILYRVFGDREGLLLALAERFATELGAALATPLAGSDPHAGSGAGPEVEPKEVLRATIDAYVALIERDPELYRFLTERLAGSAERPIAGLADEVARNVAVVLGERLRSIGADSGAAEPWAYALVGMVHLAGDWWVNRRTMARSTLVDYLVALVWDGMAALGPAPAD